jgi:60 kDa SS-A/Ro ribonucleoprotein
VWEALLADMPLTALLRNLATMTRVGLLAPGSAAARKAVAELTDEGRLRKARVHPLAVLIALKTYASGRGLRGSGTWEPVPEIVKALDRAFYLAFRAVEPTGKRWLLALDVSGSMSCGTVAGAVGLTPRVASAAMALVTAATEKSHTLLGFSNVLVPVPIEAGMTLDQATAAMDRIPMGGTDCSLPMLHAARQKLEVDTFVVYTDSETWAGKVNPHKALVDYRQKMGIPAKLIVCGMVSNGFTIADPNDAGMLDMVGFDASAPAVMSDFARN